MFDGILQLADVRQKDCCSTHIRYTQFNIIYIMRTIMLRAVNPDHSGFTALALIRASYNVRYV